MPVLSKSAALLGLAAADRSLFAPVAAPVSQQLAPAYQPAAYALSADAVAPPMNLVQPVEYFQPADYVAAEPQGADSQFWLWTGVGALAVLGAAAARSEPSAVADLDGEDLESARIATLAVGGETGRPKRLLEKNAGPQKGLLAFLMRGRKDTDGTFGKLEILSGATKPGSDTPKMLNERFQILYDTRGLKQGQKVKAQKAAKKTDTDTRGAWRSKNPTKGLY
jgi:hypothetical protein